MEKLQQICLAALKQLPEGVVIVNDEDRIVFMNPKAEEIRHVAAGSRIGGSILDCHSPKSRDRVSRAIEFIKQNPNRPFIRVVHDSQRDAFYENTYSRLTYGENDAIGALVISRDITDKRKMEKEAAARMESLERNSRIMAERLEGLLTSAMMGMANVLEAKDQYTNGHSVRVRDVSVRMAEHIFDVSPELKEIEIAASLHDIGKVGIREDVLHKPGRLADDERDHMMRHPVIGWEILQPFTGLQNISSYVHHHHERYDGKGYPSGLKGDQIPVCAQIIAVADTYDAMTSDRPYRSAMKPEIAAAEIEKNLGSQFGPKIGRVFLELFRTGSI